MQDVLVMMQAAEYAGFVMIDIDTIAVRSDGDQFAVSNNILVADLPLHFIRFWWFRPSLEPSHNKN